MHLPPMRPSFGTSLPQIVTHICQKAIFKHALGEEVTVKNKFFTDKFLLTPKFAGVGSMEDYYGIQNTHC